MDASGSDRLAEALGYASNEQPSEPEATSDKEVAPWYRERSRKEEMPLRDWHKQLVDYILLNPGIKQNQLAAVFGVTGAWLSTIKNSDAFKDYFDQRLKEHQDQVTRQVIAEAGGVALIGLQKMKERMERQGDTVSMGDLTKAAETSGKMMGLGMGSGGQGTQPVTVNFNHVDPAMLAAAREKMLAIGEKHSSDYRAQRATDAELVEGVLSVEYSEEERELRPLIIPVRETEEDHEASKTDEELVQRSLDNPGWEDVDTTE